MLVATKTIVRPEHDEARIDELDRLYDPDSCVADRREDRRTGAEDGAGAYIDQGGPQPGDPRVERAIANGQRLGLVNARLAATASSTHAQRRDRRRARSRVRVLRPAHLVRPLPAAPSRDPPRDRDAAAVLHADRVRADRDDDRDARAVPAAIDARVPAELADAVQRGARAAAASCSSPMLHVDREVHGRGRGTRGRASGWRTTAMRSRGSPIESTLGPLQRDRAVALDARRVGVRGDPGRQAQGRNLRVPPSACTGSDIEAFLELRRQHRRRRERHAQPQHRELDPGSVHGASTRTARGACSKTRRRCEWGEAFDRAECVEIRR